ncbi:MAG TPA: helix-turn-helix transcriptional regulator [Thermoanaerobaculia bacterium]|nr:helix-turn-helix transcriptional regulator [Thermoanaerobaculia bacterium]
MAPPDDYRDVLVERLRALIHAHGLSVRRLEQRIGYGRGYVADALGGHKRLAIEVILEVLAALEVPPEQFFEKPARGRRAPRAESAGGPPPAPQPRGRRRAAESPLVQAVLLLLAQQGLSEAELDTIRQAVMAPARRSTSRPQVGRKPATRR